MSSDSDSFEDDLDYFKENYYDLIDIVTEMEERMEERGGATVQDVPSFVVLTQYSEGLDLDLPDHVDDDNDEFVIGKGIHKPQDILQYAFFLIQTIASDNMLGPEETSDWLRQVRRAIMKEKPDRSEE